MQNKELQCSIYKKCNGCQMRNLLYKEQIKHKQKMLNEKLSRFAKVDELISMDNSNNYRNKVQMAFKKVSAKKIYSGIYQSKTNTITPVKECLLDDKRADEIIKTITKLIISFKLQPYDYIKQKGFLRHVLVRTGFKSSEIMVVLVTTSPIFAVKNKFVNALLERHPEITTIVVSVNDFSNKLSIGNKQEVLYGKGYITDTLCDLKFQISPKSFYQINPVMTEKMYNKAIEFAEIKKGDKVLDAYCGIGTISLVAAKTGADVVGVELNKDAYKDAIINANLNKIKNAYFYNEDATEFIKKLAMDKEEIDVVILDPPRAGSTRSFINSVSELSPEKVVYVSCNPVTLKRDLDYFKYKGFKIMKIQPFDMFPHTHHVETVVLMSRVDK